MSVMYNKKFYERTYLGLTFHLFHYQLAPFSLLLKWSIAYDSEMLFMLLWQIHCKRILCCKHLLWDSQSVWSNSAWCELVLSFHAWSICLLVKLINWWHPPNTLRYMLITPPSLLYNLIHHVFSFETVWAETEVRSLESSRWKEGFEGRKPVLGPAPVKKIFLCHQVPVVHLMYASCIYFHS